MEVTGNIDFFGAKAKFFRIQSNVNSTSRLIFGNPLALEAFLRLLLARFSREMAYLPSQKNLANESLRNCDVRQVLCILTNLVPRACPFAG